MKETYDLSGVLPGGTLQQVSAGTNFVILGPSLTGKRELAYQLIATGYDSEEGILCVTTDSAESVHSRLNQHIDSLNRDRVGIIDAAGGGEETAFDVPVENVSSPDDLTGISIGTAKLSEYFAQHGISDIRYGLISISTLLQYLPSQKVFQFLHVYAKRIGDTGGLGLFTLNTDTHDQQVVNTIRGQFDGAIELRESAAGELEVRTRGFGRRPTPWVAL